MLLSVPWFFQLAPCFPVSPTVENVSALSFLFFFFQGKTIRHCLVRPQLVYLFVRWSLGCFHFLGHPRNLHKFSFVFSVLGCLTRSMIVESVLCLASLLWISQLLFHREFQPSIWHPASSVTSILGFFISPSTFVIFPFLFCSCE